MGTGLVGTGFGSKYNSFLFLVDAGQRGSVPVGAFFVTDLGYFIRGVFAVAEGRLLSAKGGEGHLFDPRRGTEGHGGARRTS